MPICNKQTKRFSSHCEENIRDILCLFSRCGHESKHNMVLTLISSWVDNLNFLVTIS
jgi:hypothetical protein